MAKEKRDQLFRLLASLDNHFSTDDNSPADADRWRARSRAMRSLAPEKESRAMPLDKEWFLKRLGKKANRGMRGRPAATGHALLSGNFRAYRGAFTSTCVIIGRHRLIQYALGV
jgi:hypothetical protein